MYRDKFYIFVTVVTLGLLTGCGGTGAPSCSDGDVKQLVIDLSIGEFKNALLSQAIMSKLGTTPQTQGNPTYEQWNKLKEKQDTIKKIIIVDNKIIEINMKLTGIRINSVEDEIKKSSCGGNLIFSSGDSHSIEYTAQYTEDGQVYVNVFGL